MDKGHTVYEMPAAQEDEYQEVAWGVPKHGEKFEPMHINRAKVAPGMVKFKMLFCGICHTDMHSAHGDFGPGEFPRVPGHELLGQVVEVGEGVTKFKIGEHVGVGCFVDSCLDCEYCADEQNQQCDSMVETYNAVKKRPARTPGNQAIKTHGGYSGSHCVNENFVCHIPKNIPLEKAGPLMCAGITMYDPLRHWGFLDGGKTVGIIGIGGLGTMGIKIANALGHKVVAISTTAAKEQMAKEKGASAFVASTDPESIKAQAGQCNIILNTVSANHDLNVYLPLLKKNGILVQMGAAPAPHAISQLGLMFKRQTIAGSLIGGIKSTQEMLELCSKHQIWPETETIKADKIDWAFEQLATSNKDAIRYVIDIQASIADGYVPKN